MPAGNAWEAGELCRGLDFLCTGVDGDIKVAADLAVAGLVFAGAGLGSLIAYSSRQNTHIIVFASFALWVLASVLLLASWAVFTSTLGKDAQCKVEAESGKGVVVAAGRFSDIINESGSFTYGFVIGSWLVAFIPIVLIALRINDISTKKLVDEVDSTKKPVEEVDVKLDAQAQSIGAQTQKALGMPREPEAADSTVPNLEAKPTQVEV